MNNLTVVNNEVETDAALEVMFNTILFEDPRDGRSHHIHFSGDLGDSAFSGEFLDPDPNYLSISTEDFAEFFGIDYTDGDDLGTLQQLATLENICRVFVNTYAFVTKYLNIKFQDGAVYLTKIATREVLVIDSEETLLCTLILWNQDRRIFFTDPWS